ncbi:hypothetical protein IGI04_001035 [Brassica rapa subsp. trilocularis]|uniref:Uncharacterized protein n=1 Tax=Brassica rapa subsp. trilocularis TaxID=1813537 RepID=A0ABQ7NRG6_BRACM|nr:hypothetical protein IGI04_001035 [Brassica rapa subsp. trilocularis]
MECSRDGQSWAMPADSWRSDLPIVLPIRTKRLDIFPKDNQKQISEAKRMGTLPDLSVILSAQLGLIGGEGSLAAAPRVDAIPPSSTRNTGKGKKRKRGGSETERSVEETSDVPPSGELQKKKKRKRAKRKGGGVQEEELRAEEEALEDGALGEKDDEEEAVDGEESEASLGDARSDNLEEESEGLPLLIRRRGVEADNEAQSPAPMSPYAEAPVRPNIGAGPAPLAYVPEKCGELLRQFRGRVKPLPAVKDLIFGGEYEEAARAKLLGDSAMNIVIDKYDTAMKGALGELKADLVASRGGETPNRGNLAAEDNAPLLVLSDTSAEGSRRGNEEENVGMFEEVPRSDEMHVSPVARESSVRASELSALNDRESDREEFCLLGFCSCLCRFELFESLKLFYLT